MEASCQFAIYPLGADGGRTLEAALDAVRSGGLSVSVGSMSSEIRGPLDEVFEALRAAFAAGGPGERVMIVTISNACADDHGP